jgi:hypothetical protein
MATNTEKKENNMYKKDSKLTQLEELRIHPACLQIYNTRNTVMQLSACTKSYMRSQWVLQLTVVVRMRREVGRREF